MKLLGYESQALFFILLKILQGLPSYKNTIKQSRTTTTAMYLAKALPKKKVGLFFRALKLSVI